MQYANGSPESKDNAAKTLMLWCVQGAAIVPSDNTCEAMARARKAHRKLKRTLKLPLQFSDADLADMKIATDDERLPQAREGGIAGKEGRHKRVKVEGAIEALIGGIRSSCWS